MTNEEWNKRTGGYTISWKEQLFWLVVLLIGFEVEAWINL